MQFDPRLRISEDFAYDLEATGFGPAIPSVVVSSAYPVPLTCEVVDHDLFVRAATGDEVTDTLTTGDFEPGDLIEWPGDTPARVGRDLEWRERLGDSVEVAPAVRLWSGEVILRNGQGMTGPFFVHHMAAAAWAFSTAIEQDLKTVFQCQVVPYACIRQFAPGLLECGHDEARRLNRFDVSPLRPWGAPIPVDLPAGDSDE